MQNRKNNLKPLALKSLGENIFIKIPLYEAKEKYVVKYVNAELFAQYFGDSDTSFSHMAQVIADEFSTTIDELKSNGKKIGFAYVDMQEDPLKISMSGNLGSGRAFYQGDVFNIKGEKTPLVRSTREEYSNGILEYEKAMRETIASNSLYNDTNIKLAPILAILDINEPYEIKYKSVPTKKSKIVRMNIDGALNRITHIFKGKKPLKTQEMLDMAKAFGEHEAEKFLQRIEHGAWSAGNISQYAHMIDFDTVSAVKYRAPQFSFCVWFADNHFGYEYLGQLKILKSLAKDSDINVENVEYKALKKAMLEAQKSFLLRNFTKLFGFDVPYEKYSKDIEKLFKIFDKLSRKCYPVPENLSCKKFECYECAPFDFSRLFRLYPILKRKENFDIFAAYEILVNNFADFDDFDIANFDTDDPNNRFYYKHALLKINKDFIHNLDELLQLSKECLGFIKLFDEFFDKVLAENPLNPYEIQKNAYILNEDRTNLFVPYTLSGAFFDNDAKFSDLQMHRAISAAILSNKRNGKTKFFDLFATNFRLFNEGFFAVLLGDSGMHKLSLNFYSDEFSCNENDVFEIKINKRKFPCKMRFENDFVSIQSEFFDNLNLLPNFYQIIEFYKNNKKISVTDYWLNGDKINKITNFARF